MPECLISVCPAVIIHLYSFLFYQHCILVQRIDHIIGDLMHSFLISAVEIADYRIFMRSIALFVHP